MVPTNCLRMLWEVCWVLQSLCGKQSPHSDQANKMLLFLWTEQSLVLGKDNSHIFTHYQTFVPFSIWMKGVLGGNMATVPNFCLVSAHLFYWTFFVLRVFFVLLHVFAFCPLSHLQSLTYICWEFLCKGDRNGPLAPKQQSQHMVNWGLPLVYVSGCCEQLC